MPSLGLLPAALAMGFFALGCALFCPCAAKVPAPEAPESFVQDISETTVSFEMIGVAPGIVTVDTEDGPREIEVGPFWIGRTELTWDAYDVFCLRLDRTRRPMPSPVPANPTCPRTAASDTTGTRPSR